MKSSVFELPKSDGLQNLYCLLTLSRKYEKRWDRKCQTTLESHSKMANGAPQPYLKKLSIAQGRESKLQNRTPEAMCPCRTETFGVLGNNKD